MSDRKFVDKYWRKAKPEDSVKDPPMVARFRDNKNHDWVFGDLCNWDRNGDEYPWVDEVGDGYKEAEVYDAPELVPSYVPFTAEDQDGLFGQKIEFKESNELICLVISKISVADGTGTLRVHGREASLLFLHGAKFKDTGKPFGKEVWNEVG